jgi:hypothetical protein
MDFLPLYLNTYIPLSFIELEGLPSSIFILYNLIYSIRVGGIVENINFGIYY